MNIRALTAECVQLFCVEKMFTLIACCAENHKDRFFDKFITKLRLHWPVLFFASHSSIFLWCDAVNNMDDWRKTVVYCTWCDSRVAACYWVMRKHKLMRCCKCTGAAPISINVAIMVKRKNIAQKRLLQFLQKSLMSLVNRFVAAYCVMPTQGEGYCTVDMMWLNLRYE